MPDAIGKLLQDHYVSPDHPERPKSLKSSGALPGAELTVPLSEPIGYAAPLNTGEICPDCQNATLMNEEGCRKCHTCGYREC
ncbi:MAG: hypothetical protein HGA65_20130 [Oscillochloris sp.]|nr:hypothetical protein [Oscillochloris sp.]